MTKVFTEDGLWLEETAEKTVIIGVSPYGQDEIGEVSFFSFIGNSDAIVADDVFFSVESAKAVTDAIAPISGEIVEKNVTLENNPENINSVDDDKNWIVEVKPTEKFDASAFRVEDLPIID